MYRARDRVDEADRLSDLAAVADDLDLGEEARSVAADLYLTAVPEAERSKPASIAASLYAGALVAGEERPQTAVAEAAGVSRLSVQDRWKALLEDAGFEPPRW
ncbi:MAG: transcription initiation factor IIB family protein [Halobacteriales archaeon]